jgi:hypothetical protein
VKENGFNFEKIKRKHGQILALDLTVENSELLMVYILKMFNFYEIAPNMIIGI